MAESRFTDDVKDTVVASVAAGASLPDAARAASVHPSTLKSWITRGRREGSGEYADFAAEVEAARARHQGLEPPVSEAEFRQRVEAAVRAGSVQAMTLWARLWHSAEQPAEGPRSKIDELADRRRDRGAA